MDLEEMDCLIKLLQCSRCNGYLKWSPIVLLSDGTSACGRCTTPLSAENPDGTIVRQVALEAVLQKVSFPCKFKSVGCKHRNYFDFEDHQEDACIYRPLHCPIEACEWSGSIFAIPEHFTEAHGTMVKTTLEFKLQLNEDSEGVILVNVKEVPFLVKYNYKADEAKFFFQISCLGVDKASYQIWMFNDDTKDCGVSLKRNKCHSFIEGADGVTMILDKYQAVWENSECVVVDPKIIIEKLIPEYVPPPWADNPEAVRGVRHYTRSLTYQYGVWP